MRTIPLSLGSLLVLSLTTMACGDDGETGGSGGATSSTKSASTTQASSSTQSSSTGMQVSGTAYERAAIVFATCVPDAGANRVLRFLEDGIDGTDAALDTYVKCLGAVTTGCAQAYQCGITFANDGDDCPTVCNGDILTGCDDNWRFGTDCAKFGLACLGTTCLPADAAPCVDGTPDACDGNVATRCNDGYTQRVDCAAAGQTCAVDDSDPAFVVSFCKSSDTPCAGDNACNGAAIDTCDFANNVLTTPCGQGETCNEVGTEPYCGTDVACDPFAAPTCNGTVISACHGGVVVEIDCTSLGFTSCTSDGDRTRCGPGW